LKHHAKRVVAATLTLAIFNVVLGETGQAQAAGAPGICRREAADALAGRKRISDARAKRLTGATMVRQIRPGQGITMDYRQERVTIETDPKTGRIVRAYCG
jgi:hypothetical protein